jgi:hypothetical protein
MPTMMTTGGLARESIGYRADQRIPEQPDLRFPISTVAPIGAHGSACLRALSSGTGVHHEKLDPAVSSRGSNVLPGCNASNTNAN